VNVHSCRTGKRDPGVVRAPAYAPERTSRIESESADLGERGQSEVRAVELVVIVELRLAVNECPDAIG
jgi:hypothetical protein